MTDKKTTPENRNNLSYTEEKELLKWFEKVSKAADRNNISVSVEETENAWQTVAQKAELNTEHHANFKLSGLHYAAAAVFLLFAIGIAYLFNATKFTAAPGSARIIQLSDQTSVTLNSGSTLSYSSLYGWGKREVTLSGEAYFEVTHTGEPFTVITENARITVLGTKFNVKTGNGKKANKTIVFLKEGKVAFAPKGQQKQAVILEPGQMSLISERHPRPTQPKEVTQENAMDWLHQKLSFKDKSLSYIFKTLEERYGVKIKVEGIRVLSDKLTIYISHPKGIEQTLSDICRAKGLRFTGSNDKTFTVFRD